MARRITLRVKLIPERIDHASSLVTDGAAHECVRGNHGGVNRWRECAMCLRGSSGARKLLSEGCVEMVCAAGSRLFSVMVEKRPSQPADW